MIDIGKLKQVLADATPGEWKIRWHHIGSVSTGYDIAGIYDYDEGGIIYPEDALAIVALYNAAPALLAELEAAKAALDAVYKIVTRQLSDPQNDTAALVEIAELIGKARGEG